jgi:hypothetical protein
MLRLALKVALLKPGTGKNTGLKKLDKGDFIAFYSPRTEFKGEEKLQAFTAIGRVTDKKPYQTEMSPNFHPWRRHVEFFECKKSPIRPLIENLSFIKNKENWGYPFRRGLFEIERADFERIARTMNVNLESKT